MTKRRSIALAFAVLLIANVTLAQTTATQRPLTEGLGVERAPQHMRRNFIGPCTDSMQCW